MLFLKCSTWLVSDFSTVLYCAASYFLFCSTVQYSTVMSVQYIDYVFSVGCT